MVRSKPRFFDQENACLLLHLSQPSTNIFGRRARATIPAIPQIGKQRPIFGQLAPVVDEALGNQLGVKWNLPGRAFVFALWNVQHPRRADTPYVTGAATGSLIQTTARKGTYPWNPTAIGLVLATRREQDHPRLIVAVTESPDLLLRTAFRIIFDARAGVGRDFEVLFRPAEWRLNRAQIAIDRGCRQSLFAEMFFEPHDVLRGNSGGVVMLDQCHEFGHVETCLIDAARPDFGLFCPHGNQVRSVFGGNMTKP